MTKPHKHAAIIKAWADGAEIECRDTRDLCAEWRPIRHPAWRDWNEYRVKPAPDPYAELRAAHAAGAAIEININHSVNLDPDWVVLHRPNFNSPPHAYRVRSALAPAPAPAPGKTTSRTVHKMIERHASYREVLVFLAERIDALGGKP